jgi:hypothetical protein
VSLLVSKVPSARLLVGGIALSFALFFFFLAFPYYYLLDAVQYVPKADSAWGFFAPNSPAAWFFLVLAFVFLALAVALIVLLAWKRPDLTLRGYHQF